MKKQGYYYRLHLSTWQEAEKPIEKSVGLVHLNIQRFSAGHSSWPLQLACASQPGRQGARARTVGGTPCSFSWITNKVQTEAWHRCQCHLRTHTELYSLGYYGLEKSESVQTSSGAKASSFGMREGSIKTDNFAYSAFIVFSNEWKSYYNAF